MAGLTVRLSSLIIALSLVVMTTSTDDGHFKGGTMSFYFEDTEIKDTYKAHITVITGWELGHGPCGPTCTATDVGQPTKSRRDSVIHSTNDPVIFGSWTKEKEPFGAGDVVIESMTTEVNQDIEGRVSAVSPTLHYEQEIAHVEINVNASFNYIDVGLSGDSWKSFGLNHRGPGSGSSGLATQYNLQTKIYPRIRNDTGRPNSSPLVLYKPVYRIALNEVTEIRLTSSDKDGDYIKCRKGQFVEIDAIGEMPSVTVSDDCVITVSTMERDGFQDDSWGVICVVLEDQGRHPIDMEGQTIKPYTNILSSSILDFMVWVVTNVTVPEFVTPTPESQHVFTVYAGSLLSIPLAAKPSDQSPINTEVVAFHLLSLPDHDLQVPTPQLDPSRPGLHVMNSALEWRTSDSDTGDFIIQAVAVDSEGFESLDRNYKIHVSVLQQSRSQRTDEKPYFPFFPEPGSITCLQNATCSVPIFAKAGTRGHNIISIKVVTARTDIPEIKSGNVVPVVYGGLPTFRADVHFTADMIGNKAICFVARDDQNLETERCVDVSLYPPNPCDVQPCEHGGTCIPDGAQYKCICNPLYSGDDCKDWVDPCLSTPCQYGGTCLSNYRRPTRFMCKCTPGYTGSHSCSNIDECESSPCQNGGICVDGIASFHCICINGYTGSDCTSKLANDPCDGKDCHGGTCVVDSNNGGQAICKCPLGTQGDDCSPCALRPVDYKEPSQDDPRCPLKKI